MIKIDAQDIQSLITFIEAGTEPDKIVNFIKQWIYNPDLEDKS